MNLIRDIISFNVARFNRIKRKPFKEIITYIFKRFKIFFIHLRDILYMIFKREILSEDQFFQKLALENPKLYKVKQAFIKNNLTSSKIELVYHMKSRDIPKFFFNHNKKEKILYNLKKYFKKSKKQTIKLAEEIIDHRFHILGRNIKFHDKIDWHSSLNGEKRWPLSFSPNIDYFSSKRIGDIKLAWELNRTQHFVILGKAFWFTKDEKFLQEFQNQLLDWIKENPYKRGINWMEGIEVSIRLISWIWAYFFFLTSKSFNDEAHYKFLKSVYLQTKFIEEHLSDKWRLNNNHLIAEAVGLIYVGIMFPEFSEAERWKKKGLSILENELNKQILSDGVTWERSTGYHRFITDLCLHVVILAKMNDIEIPKKILIKLENMIEFLNQITKIDGRIPLIGDGDDARVLKIDETDYDDARSTITVGSILFGRKNWIRIKSEEAFWLLGTSALIKEQLPIFQGSKLFKDSGYCVMRGKGKYLLFVLSPKEKKYFYASHTHLDMLSFVLDSYGIYFLVDPGTYTYFGDFKWRKYFRSIKAHNTVVLNDDDPVHMKEIFELSSIPTSNLLEFSINDKFDFIVAKHDGYKSMSHIRSILYIKPEYWIIIDFIKGVGNHLFDLYFHINHNLNVIFNNNLNIEITNQLGTLYIVPLIINNFKCDLIEGEISRTYGKKTKAQILRFRKKGYMPQTFITILHPYQKKDNKKNIIKQAYAIRKDKTIEIIVKFENYTDHIYYNNILENKTSFKNVNKKYQIKYTRKKYKKIKIN